MKYSAALSLALAPLAIAKAIHNDYPLHPRKEHKGEGGDGGLALLNGAVGAGSTTLIVVWANPGGGAATTTINEQVTVTETVTAGAGEGAAATSAAAAAAATHTVIVGGTAGLVFTPSSVAAAVGDMVIFTFMSQMHTATQSSFGEPCTPLEGGMDSGTQPNPNNTVVPAPQIAMQVMTTEPLWFYCKTGNHCGTGMTFSVNPTAEKSQALFQAKAIQQKGKGTGSAITGNGTAVVSSPAGEAASASATATASGAAGAVETGSGAVEAGACVCAVTCSTVEGFPAAQAQGLGAFGGFAGALPRGMMETV